MTNKTKITSISKGENHCLFIFPKEQKLFEIIRKILEKLGFEQKGYNTI